MKQWLLGALLGVGLLGCMPLFAAAELPRANCGMMGDDGAITGDNYEGYWRTTFGTIRLVHVGPNVLEGPSTSSGYLKGVEQGTHFQGRIAEDPGDFYAGNVTLEISQNGRCMKGTYRLDGDKEINEIIGFRMRKPSDPYWDGYELTARTEHLKRMLGGVVDLHTIDAEHPTLLPPSPVSAAPALSPLTPADDDTPVEPAEAESETSELEH